MPRRGVEFRQESHLLRFSFNRECVYSALMMTLGHTTFPARASRATASAGLRLLLTRL
ncbi:hypothetical protein Salmuc_03232 [Salipiger mucosus DSM 16094]|uniref:Uncharacterized protein n=1 Tax=Salipiger mucosus DSM 16094 TaxID=1123237 RepID=S9QS18_9RHOB|nr:hypothetical protein Salmuc_03232 [Salipiger mucosus DSM 16094]